MKFFQAVIAVVAAFASLSEAKITAENKAEWKKELNHRMNNNMYDKNVLMAGAKPYNDAAKHAEAMRHLGNNNNNNNNNFQISSDLSIQFISCFSLSTSYDELFENANNNNNKNGGSSSTALMLMKNGKLVAERSYAIFKLCYSTQCDYASNDKTLEYIVDLAVYVQALVMYLPDQVEAYCEGCQQNEDACLAQYNGMYGYQNNGGYQYNGGNHRSLSEIVNQDERRTEQGQVVRQLDCNLCVQYGCIGNNNNNNNNNNKNNAYGFEAAAEWLISISQCYNTGAIYSNGGYYQQGGQDQGNMYAGFICNEGGTGVEIGMFLDEECILYLPTIK
jgi:hypothetical protein